MKKILIIVDMLNDFVHKDGVLYFKDVEKITNKIKELIKTQSYYSLIYLCDSHKSDDKEFEKFPPHAIKNTWGAEIIDDLNPNDINRNVEEVTLIVEKQRYSGFYNTDLNHILYFINPDEIEVVGVCTSICVMGTVGGLTNRDYNVIVRKEMVADFDPEMHKFSLERMKNIYGTKII